MQCNAHATFLYPSVLSSDIVQPTPRKFNQVLRMRRDCILGTYASDLIAKVEDEFKEFKAHVSLSALAQDALEISTEAFQQ